MRKYIFCAIGCTAMLVLISSTVWAAVAVGKVPATRKTPSPQIEIIKPGAPDIGDAASQIETEIIWPGGEGGPHIAPGVTQYGTLQCVRDIYYGDPCDLSSWTFMNSSYVPKRIAQDEEGFLYIAYGQCSYGTGCMSLAKDRIQSVVRWTPSKFPLWEWKTFGSRYPNFDVGGMTLLDDGSIYFINRSGHPYTSKTEGDRYYPVVWKFKYDGCPEDSWGDQGMVLGPPHNDQAKGEFNRVGLTFNSNIIVHPFELFISDPGNRRIQILGNNKVHLMDCGDPLATTPTALQMDDPVFMSNFFANHPDYLGKPTAIGFFHSYLFVVDEKFDWITIFNVSQTACTFHDKFVNTVYTDPNTSISLAQIGDAFRNPMDVEIRPMSQTKAFLYVLDTYKSGQAHTLIVRRYLLEVQGGGGNITLSITRDGNPIYGGWEELDAHLNAVQTVSTIPVYEASILAAKDGHILMVAGDKLYRSMNPF